MSALHFYVPGPPHGKGRPRASLRGGHVRMYTDKRTVAYEDRVALHAAEAMGDLHKPLDGPVRVSIMTFRQRPKKPARAHECRSGFRFGSYRSCTSKPDADNCAKAVLDGCTLAGVWRDDVQVVSLSVLQLWCNEGEQPRTSVRVEKLVEVCE